MDNIPTFISDYYSLSTSKREEEELYKILNEFKGREYLILEQGKEALFYKNCGLSANTIYDIACNIGSIKQYDGQPKAILDKDRRLVKQRFKSDAVANTEWSAITLTEENSLIFSLATPFGPGGVRDFRKVNGGLTIVAYQNISIDYRVPVLCSETKEGVTYKSIMGSWQYFYSLGSFTYHGKTYYYNGGSYACRGTILESDLIELVKLDSSVAPTTTNHEAPLELLERYYYQYHGGEE